MEQQIRLAIVSALRKYKTWKERLKMLEELYQEHSYLRGVTYDKPAIQKTDISDSTGNTAIKLVELPEETKRVALLIRIVEHGTQAMTDKQYRLIERRYFNMELPYDIMDSMSISKAEYYTIHDQALNTFYGVLGDEGVTLLENSLNQSGLASEKRKGE